ncbi:NlpC/P60 family protein [Pseudonocardia sp. H11422]|uniref:NlpC/P60 family protein n=1 Tax=Pseudonocardia sp. H11422 TaxID=2835866 RepID=UPI001BDC0D26|nr:NlpC/P60 family protein [Pseudonocardia sp. H11422]
MTVCNDPDLAIRPATRPQDSRGGRRRGDRPGPVPPPYDNPRPDSGRFTATWVLAALLGMVTVGTLPSAAPITSVPARTSRDVPPLTDDARPRALPTGPGLSVIAGSVPSPRPVPARELRPADFTTSLPDGRARIAVETAMAQLGLPYQWGGDGPAAGDRGFDCSGLTTFSYAAAGITLPRTAHTQYHAGPHVPAGAALQPGDLVFYGTAAKVHHVGMYIGEGRMVNAPTFGTPVRTSYYRWRGDDYLGATRPAATGESSPGLLPHAPPPAPPLISESPREFDAPPAPLPPGPLPLPSDSLPPEPTTAASAIAASDLVAGPSTTNAEPSTTNAEPSAGIETPGLVDPVSIGRPPGAVAPSAPGGTVPPGGAGPAAMGPVGQDAGTEEPQGAGASGMPEPGAPAVPGTATGAASTAEPPLVKGSAPAAGSGAAADPALPQAPANPPAPAGAPAAPAATTPREVMLPGGTVALTPVEQQASGLPAVPPAGGGSWSGDGHTTITLSSPEPAEAAGPGTPITVSYRDGTTRSFTVRDRTIAATSVAARLPADAPAGQLLVLAPVGPDDWVVLVAS